MFFIKLTLNAILDFSLYLKTYWAYQASYSQNWNDFEQCNKRSLTLIYL